MVAVEIVVMVVVGVIEGADGDGSDSSDGGVTGRSKNNVTKTDRKSIRRTQNFTQNVREIDFITVIRSSKSCSDRWKLLTLPKHLCCQMSD